MSLFGKLVLYYEVHRYLELMSWWQLLSHLKHLLNVSKFVKNVAMTTMILVVFPMDFLEHGIYGNNFSLLGLGDIVLPGNKVASNHEFTLLITGIFVALLCRYDARSVWCWLCYDDTHCYRQHPDRNRLYFIVSFIAYIIGLVITIVVMHTFKAAQVGDN